MPGLTQLKPEVDPEWPKTTQGPNPANNRQREALKTTGLKAKQSSATAAKNTLPSNVII